MKPLNNAVELCDRLASRSSHIGIMFGHEQASGKDHVDVFSPMGRREVTLKGHNGDDSYDDIVGVIENTIDKLNNGLDETSPLWVKLNYTDYDESNTRPVIGECTHSYNNDPFKGYPLEEEDPEYANVASPIGELDWADVCAMMLLRVMDGCLPIYGEYRGHHLSIKRNTTEFIAASPMPQYIITELVHIVSAFNATLANSVDENLKWFTLGHLVCDETVGENMYWDTTICKLISTLEADSLTSPKSMLLEELKKVTYVVRGRITDALTDGLLYGHKRHSVKSYNETNTLEIFNLGNNNLYCEFNGSKLECYIQRSALILSIGNTNLPKYSINWAKSSDRNRDDSYKTIYSMATILNPDAIIRSGV